MQGRRTTIVAAALLFGAIGCANVDDKALYRDVQQTTVKAATVATKVASTGMTSATATYQRMQRYLAEKDLLKTFTDAGEHSEADLLAVLHKTRANSPGSTSTRVARSHSDGSASSASNASSAQHAPASMPQPSDAALRWPIDAGIVSSEYGERWGKMHKGIDIAAESGEPVYAVAEGEVIYAGSGLRGYGNVVILKHDRGMTTLYAHNSELKVKQGEHLTRGSLIALMGSTGHSTGPHVHFEIREGDTPVNPRSLLPKSKLAGAVGQAAAVDDTLLSRR